MVDVVPARTAASVLVVRPDPLEVLMVRRNGRGSYPSALVFPGGVIEPHDAAEAWLAHVDGAPDSVEDRAWAIAAVRETFEEAGIVVAATGGLSVARDASFLDAVGDAGLRIDLARIHLFAHWVTPEPMARRFDTRFYIVEAPADQIATADGSETVEIEWLSPADVIARSEAGDGTIMFPTLMNLELLAARGSLQAAIAELTAHPARRIQPTVSRDPDGVARITIPEDAGYARSSWRSPTLPPTVGPIP